MMTFPSEIQAIQATNEFLPSQPMQSTSRAGNADFAGLVTQGLSEVNGQLLRAETDLQRLAVGDVQNLHEVMIRMEEAQLSFQLFMQARNRLLEAYQDVMKMQV